MAPMGWTPSPCLPARRVRWRSLALTVLLTITGASAAGGASAAEGAGHAVVLLYHHVAEDTPASTSVSPDTFAAHLDFLAANDYQVVALERIIGALEGSEAGPLPPRAVAITFDDAYRSVVTHAAPRLAERGYPYTVFVSTDYIDGGYGGYLSWEELRELETRGATIANHSRSHDHFVHRRPGESERHWRARIGADIQAAQDRLATELSQPLKAIAYPYGEFDPALTELTADLGMTGFGQQSGPIGPASDLRALPRFPMASGYADLEGFAEKLRTRPFQVEVLSEVGPVLAPDAGAPALRLELSASDARFDALSCFVTGQEPPAVRWVDRSRGIVEVQARAPLPVGRSKYTCTAPSRREDRSFYWYSHLWMKPPAPGTWYRD